MSEKPPLPKKTRTKKKKKRIGIRIWQDKNEYQDVRVQVH